MCGIWGSASLTPGIQRMLPHLAISMLARGQHSWGASDGYEIIRHVGPIYKTWAAERERISQWDAGIFHTRHASVGSADDINNAHPFTAHRADESEIIGIHNGTLTNHTELNAQRSRHCTVDSQHIWLHLAEGRPFTELRGSANLAWWDIAVDSTRTLNLARINSTSLNIARLEDGGIIFCSELQPLQIAAHLAGVPVVSTYTVDEFRRYILTGQVLFSTEDELKFGVLPHTRHEDYSYTSHGSSYSYPNSGYLPTSDYCSKCSKKKLAKTDFFCLQCLGERFNGFIKWRKDELAGLHTTPGGSCSSSPTLPGILSAEDLGGMSDEDAEDIVKEFGFYSAGMYPGLGSN